MPAKVPVPTDLHTRYPSTQWGVTDWFIALADNDLYYRILDGIAHAHTPKKHA